MRIPAVLTALGLIYALPFALVEAQRTCQARRKITVVIVTPHNEQIRYEFSRAFGEHFLSRKRPTHYSH